MHHVNDNEKHKSDLSPQHPRWRTNQCGPYQFPAYQPFSVKTQKSLRAQTLVSSKMIRPELWLFLDMS